MSLGLRKKKKQKLPCVARNFEISGRSSAITFETYRKQAYVFYGNQLSEDFIRNRLNYSLKFSQLCFVLQTEYLSVFKLFEYHYWVAESMSWRLVGQLVGG